MERRYELEYRRRSLAMLRPGADAGWRREEAIALIEDVQRLEERLEQVRGTLRRLAEDLCGLWPPDQVNTT